MLEELLKQMVRLNENLEKLNQRLDFASPIQEIKPIQNSKLKQMLAGLKTPPGKDE